MVTAIRIPKRAAAGTSAFVKLGARRYLVISIAMVAARLVVDGRHCHGSGRRRRLLFGGRQAARRLSKPRLRGSLPARQLAEAVLSAPMAELSPIADVRGSAEYRLDAAREIVARAVLGACGSTNDNSMVAA